LLATHVAALNRCEYCVVAHRRLAGFAAPRRSRWPAWRIRERPFTEKEKAGFRYASLLHGSGNAIDDAAYAALSEHFDFTRLWS